MQDDTSNMNNTIASVRELVEMACLLQRIDPAVTGLVAARVMKLAQNWSDVLAQLHRSGQFKNRVNGSKQPDAAAFRYLGMELAAIISLFDSEMVSENVRPHRAEIQQRLNNIAADLHAAISTINSGAKLKLPDDAEMQLGLLDVELLELAA